MGSGKGKKEEKEGEARTQTGTHCYVGGTANRPVVGTETILEKQKTKREDLKGLRNPV